MHRTTHMTIGFVLFFLGLQLAVVDSYVLTSRVANFLSEQGQITTESDNFLANQNLQAVRRSPQFNQVAYQQPLQVARVTPVQRRIKPPQWLCWPLLFCGTVVFLHGFSKPSN